MKKFYEREFLNFSRNDILETRGVVATISNFKEFTIFSNAECKSLTDNSVLDSLYEGPDLYTVIKAFSVSIPIPCETAFDAICESSDNFSHSNKTLNYIRGKVLNVKYAKALEILNLKLVELNLTKKFNDNIIKHIALLAAFECIVEFSNENEKVLDDKLLYKLNLRFHNLINN